MVNDGTLHYDHDRDGTHGQVDGCTVSCRLNALNDLVVGILILPFSWQVKFRNRDHDTYVTISYIDRVLTVSVYTFLSPFLFPPSPPPPPPPLQHHLFPSGDDQHQR